MLDLDQLADNRAKTLNQQPEGWRKAIWSSGFQKLSTNMTDGEVEGLIALCPTVGHLEWVIGYLQSQALMAGTSPFTVLNAEAAKASLPLEQWIAKCFSLGSMQ